MPRYFFDIDEAGQQTADAFGEELDSAEEAREHAQAILAQLLRERLPNGEHMVCSCEVRDERGIVVYLGSLTYEGQRGKP